MNGRNVLFHFLQCHSVLTHPSHSHSQQSSSPSSQNSNVPVYHNLYPFGSLSFFPFYLLSFFRLCSLSPFSTRSSFRTLSTLTCPSHTSLSSKRRDQTRTDPVTPSAVQSSTLIIQRKPCLVPHLLFSKERPHHRQSCLAGMKN